MPVCGQEGPSLETLRQIDSLKNVLEMADYQKRIDTYQKLADIYAGELNTAVQREWLEKAAAEARKAGDAEEEGKFRTFILSSLSNDDRNKFLEELPKTLEFLEKHKNWYHYFKLYELKVKCYLYSDASEQAQQVAQEMYDMAKEVGYLDGAAVALTILGRMYHGANKYEQAREAFQEAREIAVEHSTFFELYDNMLNLYSNQEALEICAEYEALLKEYESYPNASNMDITWYYLNLSYAEHYAEVGDLDKADEYLAKGDASPWSKHPLGRLSFWQSRSRVYFAREMFDEGIADLDSACMSALSRGSVLQAHHGYHDIAQKAYESGRYKLAADTYQMIYAQADSLMSAQSIERLNDLRTQYEVDKIEAQKERQRIIIMWSVTGCLLLSALVLLLIWHSRSLHRKNLSLYRQIQESARNEKEATKALLLTPEQKLSRELVLFRKLSEYMSTEKPFVDPSFDRLALCAHLGTNEKYLANAVREGADTTVAAYISDFRLNYSLGLLSGDPTASLDMISEASGYSAYSTFFRVFTRRYGMSPSDYRKLSTIKRNRE